MEYVPHTEALGYEVLLGFRDDPAFGPVLTVSKGGDDAEFFAAHYDPANLFLPPWRYEEALAFTRSLHIRHKFEQIGHPEYLESMARALAEFSALALHFSPLGGASPPRLLVPGGQPVRHRHGRPLRRPGRPCRVPLRPRRNGPCAPSR